MLLHLTDHSPEPLHSQVTRQVRARILAGELIEGDALPSIRTLAADNEISVITVKRAYADMERDGLIRVARRKGFTIAELSVEQKHRMALKLLEERLEPIIVEALETGLSVHQVQGSLLEILRNRR